MAGKRESTWGGVRCSDTEERFLRDVATLLDMDSVSLQRKSLAIAIPLLLGNRFIQRVELQDTIDAIGKSVSSALYQRNTREKH